MWALNATVETGEDDAEGAALDWKGKDRVKGKISIIIMIRATQRDAHKTHCMASHILFAILVIASS